MKAVEGYYLCDNYKTCKKKCRHQSGLIYFKGKFLCYHCKQKSSKCLTSIPTLNPSDATLKANTRLPEGKNMPRDRWKNRIKVTPTLKSWAERKSHTPRIKDNGHNLISVSLKPQEINFLKKHFYKEGLSDEEVRLQIEKVKANIRVAHEEYKDNLRKTKPSFKEEYEKLIGVRK